MAKRKRRTRRKVPKLGDPMSATEITRIERTVQWQFNHMKEAEARGDKKGAAFERGILTGMAQLAYDLGVKCNCQFPDLTTKKTACVCAKGEGNLKTKLERRTGYRPAKPSVTIYWQ